jgi:putative hemolysin
VPLSACSRSWMVRQACKHAASPVKAAPANRIIGVESYNVSLETQTAEIVAAESLDYETVLEKIKKTGKKVKSGEADGEEREV